MRLTNYLDELGWTQSRLWKESGVSLSTIRRMLMGGTVQRETAEDLCKALTNALGRTIRLQDVDEIKLQSTERPERRKYPRGEQ